MEEEWRPVVGYEGLYEVSSLGRVKSVPRFVKSKNQHSKYTRMAAGGALSPRADHQYLRVNLYKHGTPRRVTVHRLVLEAFVGPKSGDVQCCHNNGDCTDNRPENLRWGTFRENMADRDKHGKTAVGALNGFAKLTMCDVKIIRNLYDKTDLVQDEIAKIFNVTQSHVSRIVCGNNWRHV